MHTQLVVQKDYTRRIPIQKDWFDYHLDSIVYSFMLSSATARIKPGDKTDGSQSYLYLSQAKYKKIRPIMRQIINVTAKQINDRVKRLQQKGYIHFNEETKEYTFPYDYNEKYYIVSTQVLVYLCTVSNPFVIKIYFYLADRYSYKKNYLFTLKELRLALGYSGSENKRVTDLIKVALSSLKVMGFIDYQKVQLQGVGDTDRPIENYMLTYVAGKHLPKAISQELQNNLNLTGKQVVSALLLETKTR